MDTDIVITQLNDVVEKPMMLDLQVPISFISKRYGPVKEMKPGQICIVQVDGSKHVYIREMETNKHLLIDIVDGRQLVVDGSTYGELL